MTTGCPPTTSAPCDVAGHLIIEGVNVSIGPAFFTPNLFALWGTDFDTRGTDRLLPGVNGVIPYRRRATVTGYALDLLVSGHVDYLGTDRGTRTLNLEANLTYLRDTLVTPPGTLGGTRPATLLLPSGATRTGPVHVLRLTPGEVVAGWMRSTLSLSVPAGLLL